MTGPLVRVFEDRGGLEEEAAREFARVARNAVARRDVCRVALAGGSTPRGLYRRLATEPCRGQIPWKDVEIVFGDERCVPPDHPESNYRMAAESLLSRVPVPKRAVHRIRGEIEPSRAAMRYEAMLEACEPSSPPRLDLVILGMGADGHTASLFPGSAALDERKRLAVHVTSPAPPRDRVTLTLPVFNAARAVMFLVVGAEKAEAVARVLGASRAQRPPRASRGGRASAGARELLPAALVRPRRGRVFWFLDRAAASGLPANRS